MAIFIFSKLRKITLSGDITSPKLNYRVSSDQAPAVLILFRNCSVGHLLEDCAK